MPAEWIDAPCAIESNETIGRIKNASVAQLRHRGPTYRVLSRFIGERINDTPASFCRNICFDVTGRGNMLAGGSHCQSLFGVKHIGRKARGPRSSGAEHDQSALYGRL